MSCGPKKPSSVIPPRVIRPVWVDTLYLRATSEASWTDITLPAGTVTQIAQANPNRYALICVQPLSGATTVEVAPYADVNVMSFQQLVQGNHFVFKLFDYGPLVGYEWFGVATADQAIRVIELTNH